MQPMDERKDRRKKEPVLTFHDPMNAWTDEQLLSVLENPGFSVEKVRKDFAYLQTERPVVYVDNAATTQRPEPVLQRMLDYQRHENANPLRGNHALSAASTAAYENGRKRVQHLLNAKSEAEIIFVRNATEALNAIAYAWGLANLHPGDEVLVTRMEHHSNFVNWQAVCQMTGAAFRIVELDEDFGLDPEDLDAKLTERTKIFAFTGASNVLSTYLDVKELVRRAHDVGALAVVDGAQWIPHTKVDVQALDCDFLAFSGHKMCGPFGIGVLYGKEEILANMPPFLYGGEMIEYVEDDQATFAPLPYRLEAGTQNVGGVVGLHAAIDYLEKLGWDNIERYERALAEYAARQLKKIPGMRLFRPQSAMRGSAVTFNLRDIHPHDMSTILDFQNVAIRSGHHCTQPLHRALHEHATSRMSFAFYNTKEEADFAVQAVAQVPQWMGLEE